LILQMYQTRSRMMKTIYSTGLHLLASEMWNHRRIHWQVQILQFLKAPCCWQERRKLKERKKIKRIELIWWIIPLSRQKRQVLKRKRPNNLMLIWIFSLVQLILNLRGWQHCRTSIKFNRCKRVLIKCRFKMIL